MRPILRRATAVAALLSSALLAECSDSRPQTSCVARGTRIATPTGPVPVQDLRVGDAVYSVNPVTQVLESARIQAVRSAHRSCLEMRTESGARLVVTAEHPILSAESGRYERADRWADDSRKLVFRCTDEVGLRPERVQSCRRLAGVFQVFDLTVDSRHRNFLAEGLVAHNKSPPRPELDVQGRWRGTWKSDDAVATGDVIFELGKIAVGQWRGTATFSSPTCFVSGPLDGLSFGRFDGWVVAPDAEVLLAARVVEDKMTGSYHVQSKGPCLRELGTFEVQRVAVPLGTVPPQLIQVYEIDEGGGIRALGTILGSGR